MVYETEGEVVQIASIEQNKLLFSTDAFRNILEKVGTRPVSIVSINGPIKAEKPYVFSQFIKYLSNLNDKNWFNAKNDRFQWKSPSDRQAPGISMWSEPIIIRKNGDEVAVVFMDAHGCFDPETSTPEDLLIFALSFVLSSTLIYSISEKLSEELFQFLQLLAGYAKGSIDSDVTQNFFNLIFMVRGWQSSKYDFGFHDSSCHPGVTNYKQDSLLIDHEEMDEETQFNHYITNSNFLKIGCCLLPDVKPESYDQDHSLPTTYIDTIKQIVPRILHPSNVFIKRIGNHKFNGRDMIKLFDQLAILFDNYEIPIDRNIDEFNAEVKILTAQFTGFNYYIWEMDKTIKDNKYVTDDELKKIHLENVEKALAIFNSKMPLKYDTIENRYKDSLSEIIQNAFEFYVQANGMRSDFFRIKRKTMIMIDEFEAKIQESRNKFFSSFTELNSAVSKLISFDLEGLSGAVRNVVE